MDTATPSHPITDHDRNQSAEGSPAHQPELILPDKIALIVIDAQRFVLNMPVAPNPVDRVVVRCDQLVDTFRLTNRPVAAVRVTGQPDVITDAQVFPEPPGPGWDDFVYELARNPDSDLYRNFTKGGWSGLTMGVLTWLDSLDVSTVVLGGFLSHAGVLATAISAHDNGFNVVVAHDATTSLDAGLHGLLFAQTYPFIAQVRSSAVIRATLRKGSAARAVS